MRFANGAEVIELQMGKARVYTREFRVNVVTRIFQGEKIADLSKELGIHRKLLYEWKQQVSEGGEANLRQRGRPRKVDSVREAAENAERRISELEQLVGRQQLTIDFFRRALQRVEELRPEERQDWRDGIFETIESIMQQQGSLGVTAMCELSRVSRAGFYRYLRTRG